jgi:hypothetical protein
MELFVFKIQSVSDVITNSSSELFVFDGNNENEVREILDSIYPNWKNEYNSPKDVSKFDKEELSDFLENTREINGWEEYYLKKPDFELRKKNMELRCCELSSEIGLKPEEAYDNWEIWDPTNHEDWQNISLKISDKFVDKFKEHANKEKIFALYSLDENPDWEYQELLSEVADRYHLG